jgi:hypothetical protein
MRGPRHNTMGRPNLIGRANRDPLRRIVERLDGYEKLECGHRVPVRRDMIGPTYAFKRRCAQCRPAQGG